MINLTLPNDWRDLQNDVARILDESGCRVQIMKDIMTARGKVNIDVFAEDPAQKPPIIYLIECKYWRSAVPKTVVHSFRTIVTDYGANWGLIISLSGFQKGAYEAVQYSNIRLLNWVEFEQLFEDRWYNNYFLPKLQEAADPVVEYTEPINSRIFCKADALSPEALKRFKSLRSKYEQLAFLALSMYTQFSEGNQHPNLPLKDTLTDRMRSEKINIPDDLLDAKALREYLRIFIKHLAEAVKEFDDVFGGRA